MMMVGLIQMMTQNDASKSQMIMQSVTQKKYRSLVSIYMDSTSICSRNSIKCKRTMITLEEEKVDQGIISTAITKIESSQAIIIRRRNIDLL